LKSGTSHHTEEFILRELFREYDRNSNGSLCCAELGDMLKRINVHVADCYIEALINKFDRNGNGAMEFEEFVTFIVHERYSKKLTKHDYSEKVHFN